MFDLAVIGAGITGTAIAGRLAAYSLKIVLIEKDSDIANGATKANSAIVHAGFDPEPGSLKARFNVEGNRMFEEFCRKLDVSFKQIGSLVIAFSEEELQTLEELLKQGQGYAIPGLEIIGRAGLDRIEPGLNKEARAALYAPTAGITDPYLLAVALAESAAANSVEVRLNSPVTGIEKMHPGYRIQAGSKTIDTAMVINAAGLYSDRINDMVNAPYFQINPTRGEYFLLDKTAGGFARHVLFPCPTKLGKGVLISPTAHGNLIVGPNAEKVDSMEATETTAGGLEYVRENASKIKGSIPLNKVITSFSGLRAKSTRGDFIIEEPENTPGFINVAGIDSPGLVSAPAIAAYVTELVEKNTGPLKRKKNFYPAAKKHRPFMSLDDREKERLVEEDPRYGHVVCRCESITEAEIVRAIEGPVGARTLDGIKKRTRPGGGRCQGGFCGPKVIRILARELGLEPEEVEKNNPGSYILTGQTKKNSTKAQQNISGNSNSDRAGDTSEKANDIHDGGAADAATIPAAAGIQEPGGEDCFEHELVIIGGGPAGMAAAVAASKEGIEDILVIERDHELGGILQQCIHNGFGLHQFREELTGPEYAERFINQLREQSINCRLNSMVLAVGKDRQITYINGSEGLRRIRAGAIVLAMGCRERTRGAINIPGTRPAGIFSAGSAQRLVNIEGYMVGRRVVVFGSGDIGLIMARRIVWEGGEVAAVIERKPYSEGLIRNYVQCVEDYNIPMLLQHTIINIRGKERVEGITVAATDENKEPVAGTEKDIACDTILFSRGLIPENELSTGAGVLLDAKTGGPVVNEAMETGIEGIFACGNVVHVHDLVDWVTDESYRAGRGAAAFIRRRKETPAVAEAAKEGEREQTGKPAGKTKKDTGFDGKQGREKSRDKEEVNLLEGEGEQPHALQTRPGEGISYIVPHRIRPAMIEETLELYMRARGNHENAILEIKVGPETIKTLKKKVLTPGEMIVVKIKKDELPATVSGELVAALKNTANQD